MPDFDSDRPQSSRKASNRKTRRPSKQKKDKNIVTAVATVGKKKPQSKAQRQQAIGRRKYPERPLVQCTVPASGCEVDSTTEFRKRSKFPHSFSLIPLSFTPFLKILIIHLVAHINGFHLDIKDNFCKWPGCTFATPYRSNVDRHYKRHLKKEEEKRKKLEALAALAARSYN